MAASRGPGAGEATPILMYHSVADPVSAGFRRWAVPPTLFADHCAALAEAGYRGVSVAALQQAVDPAGLIALTFDDAFADIAEALPILSRHGFAASVYVPTAHVGSTASWLYPDSEGARALLDWAGLRDLVRAGHEVGSHSHSHAHLDEMSEAEVRTDLTLSREALASQVGATATGVCYPFGHATATTRRVARELGFRYGCGVGRRMASTASDPFRLDRLEVTRRVTPERLVAMAGGRARSVGGWTPGWVRSGASSARRARRRIAASGAPHD